MRQGAEESRVERLRFITLTHVVKIFLFCTRYCKHCTLHRNGSDQQYNVLCDLNINIKLGVVLMQLRTRHTM